MKRSFIKKTFFGIILVAIFVCMTLAVSAETLTGECGAEGDNIAYSLDTEQGQLFLNGSGKMKDYSIENPAPWYEYREIITSLTVGHGITHVGDYSFYNFINFTGQVSPWQEDIVSFGAFSFYGSGIRTVYLSEAVSEIGIGAFANCKNLCSIYTNFDNPNPNQNPYFSVDYYGALYSKDFSKLIQVCPMLNYTRKLLNFSINNNTTEIGEYAFDGVELITLSLNENISYIAENAFFGSEIGAICLYEGTYADEYFKNKEEYKDKIVYCQKYGGFLTDTIIWELDLTGNRILYIDGSGEMPDFEMGNRPWEKLLPFVSGISFVDYYDFGGITKIGNYAFASEIPLEADFYVHYDSIRSIGDYAFYNLGASYPNYLWFGEGIEYIGEGAFKNCGIDHHLELKESMKYIGEDAFDSISEFYDLNIPENFSAVVDENAFGDSVIDLYLYEDTYADELFSSINMNLGHKYYLGNISGNLGENLTWELDTRKETLTISGTGDMIEFDSSSDLPWWTYDFYVSDVIVDEGVTSAYYFSSYASSPISKNYYYPKSLEKIDHYLGYVNCFVDKVYIHKGSYADEYFSQYDADIFDYYVVYISDNCTETISYNYDLDTKTLTFVGEGEIPDYDFSSYDGIVAPWREIPAERIVISDGITRVGACAFCEMESIIEIELAESVRSIGRDAFCYTGYYNDSSNWENGILYIDDFLIYGGDYEKNVHLLKSVEIKEGTKHIADYAFAFYHSLEEINLPKSIISVGNYAFSGYGVGECLIISENLQYIGEEAFGWNGASFLYLGKNIKDMSKNSFNKGFLRAVYVYSDTYAEEYCLADPDLSERMIYLDKEYGGKCGDDAYWSYDPRKAELTISGNGATYDYEEYIIENLYVEKIFVSEGITDIGYGALYCDDNYITIYLPMSLDQIDEIGGYIEEIYAYEESGVYEWLTWVFDDSKLKTYPSIYDASGDFKVTAFPDVLPEDATLSVDLLDDVDILIEKSNGELAEFVCYEVSIEIEGETIVLEDPVKIKMPVPEGMKGKHCKIYYLSENGALTELFTLLRDGYLFAETDKLGKFVVADMSVPGIDNITFPKGVFGENIVAVFNPDEMSIEFSGTGTIEFIANPEILGWEKYEEYDRFYWEHFRAVEKVVIREGITKISNYMFEYNSNLLSVEFPQSLTTIGEFAFHYCSSLDNVVITNSVVTIGEDAFAFCDSLKTVKLSNRLTEINCFSGCVSLESIELPAGVKIIGESAFYGCSSLKLINIPSMVERIENEAFYGCESLTEITLPSSLKYIGEFAFCETSIPTIHIPKKVETIEFGAFVMCNQLCSFTVDSANKNYSAENGILYDKNKTVLIAFPGALTECSNISQSVIKIGDYAFAVNPNLTKVVLPSSVKELGYGAFGECTSLSDVVLSSSLEIIGEMAFAYCSSLSEISLPAKLKTIGPAAFGLCSELSAITLPHSLEFIGHEAFYSTGILNVNIPKNVNEIENNAFYCEKLSAFTVDSENKNYSATDGVLMSKDKKSIILYPMGKTDETYVIPDGVENLISSSFAGCTSLKNIIIPDSLKTVEIDAFIECNIEAFYVDDLSVWCSIDFAEGLLGNERKLYAEDVLVTAVKGTFEKISNFAFEGYNYVTEVDIADTKTIGEFAFAYCSALEKIKFSGIEIIGAYAFTCTPIEAIDLSGVISIGQSAFEWCEKLTEIIIHEGTRNIYTLAFAWCEAVERVIIPESVEYMEWGAFFCNQNGFDLFIYENSYADEFFKSDITFVNDFIIYMTKLTDESGISIGGTAEELPENVRIKISDVEDFNFEIVKENGEEPEFVAYNISLEADGVEVQPNGSITVKIPVPEGFVGKNCVVYHYDDNGNCTNMNALYIDGYLVFTTEHFSVYVVADMTVSVPGDILPDGEINSKDAVLLAQRLAGWVVSLDEVAADCNGDGAVDTKDAVLLAQHLAGWSVTLG